MKLIELEQIIYQETPVITGKLWKDTNFREKPRK